MFTVGVALNILSLLLLTASAFRDDNRPYNIIMAVGRFCKRWVNKYFYGEPFELLTNYHRWNGGFGIVVSLMCIWFAVLGWAAWTGSYLANLHYATSHADFTTAGGFVAYLADVFFLTLLCSPILFPFLVVALVVFGMGLTWARDGGSNGKFVARVGLLAGVFGIVLQALGS